VGLSILRIVAVDFVRPLRQREIKGFRYFFVALLKCFRCNHREFGDRPGNSPRIAIEVYLPFKSVEKMGKTVEKMEGDWGNCGECLGMFGGKNKNCKFS
jgi:hypothetical protein